MTDEHRYLTPEQHAERLTERLQLALEIADETARSDIESLCVSHTDEGHLWWYARAPVNELDPWTGKAIERAVRYLDMGEQIVHHATVPVLVRFKS